MPPMRTQLHGTTSTLGYRDIATITGPSTGHSVRVVFKRTLCRLGRSLRRSACPRIWRQQVGWATGYERPGHAAFVSGGPYEVTSWIPGSRIVLGRNPKWWGTPGKIATITMEAETGSQDLNKMLASGQAQVVYSTTFDKIAVGDDLVHGDRRQPDDTRHHNAAARVRHAESGGPVSGHSPRGGARARPTISRAGARRSHSIRGSRSDDDFLAANAQRSYTSDGSQFDSSTRRKRPACSSPRG